MFTEESAVDLQAGNSGGYVLLKYHRRSEVAKTTTDMSETHKSILIGLTTWYDFSPKITL